MDDLDELYKRISKRLMVKASTCNCSYAHIYIHAAQEIRKEYEEYKREKEQLQQGGSLPGNCKVCEMVIKINKISEIPIVIWTRNIKG